MAFDSIGRIANLLDQMCSGLQTLGVLQLMRAFPDLMAPMLTYTACVTAEDVTDALYVDEDLDDHCEADKETLALLHRFIGECTEKGLRHTFKA